MSILLSSLEGNRQKLDGGAMFGNAPKALWERWFKADEQNRIELACRSLLIECDKLKILCETGIGAFFPENLAERYGVQEPTRHILLDSLKQQGLQEDEIDYVILSHLHFDHAGGLMPTVNEQKQGRTALHFPKAKYIVGEEAWKRAQYPHPRDRASFIPTLPQSLKDSGRLVIVPAKAERISDLPNEISFRYSHGHTVGHLHTLVAGTSNQVFFCGDLVPGEAWISVAMTMGYDRFPEALVDEKEALYQEAVAKGWWLFYTHDPKVVASIPVRDDKGKVSYRDSQPRWNHFSL